MKRNPLDRILSSTSVQLISMSGSRNQRVDVVMEDRWAWPVYKKICGVFASRDDAKSKINHLGGEYRANLVERRKLT
jgi:hypothetical protein